MASRSPGTLQTHWAPPMPEHGHQLRASQHAAVPHGSDPWKRAMAPCTAVWLPQQLQGFQPAVQLAAPASGGCCTRVHLWVLLSTSQAPRITLKRSYRHQTWEGTFPCLTSVCILCPLFLPRPGIWPHHWPLTHTQGPVSSSALCATAGQRLHRAEPGTALAPLPACPD